MSDIFAPYLDSKVSVRVLDGETVNSIIHRNIDDFKDILSPDNFTKLEKIIEKLVLEVEQVSPFEVESNKNLDKVRETVAEYSQLLNDDNELLNQLLNNLNLCVVGLGSAIRTK